MSDIVNFFKLFSKRISILFKSVICMLKNINTLFKLKESNLLVLAAVADPVAG